jgi:predicted component of type VI protein secretion system
MMTPRAWAGRLVPVAHLPFVIGRDPGCHLRAHTPEVAARHCALVVRGDRVFVRDLVGGRRTRVNGRPVAGEQQLRDQDRVEVGCLAFTVRLPWAAAPPRAEPAPPAEAEEAAATLLLSPDEAEAPGSTVVGLGAETLPLEGEPHVPDPAAKPARPEVGDTSAAAAQLLARYLKAPKSGGARK